MSIELWNDINGEPFGEPMAKCQVDESEMIYMEMAICKVCEKWKESCKCKKPIFYAG